MGKQRVLSSPQKPAKPTSTTGGIVNGFEVLMQSAGDKISKKKKKKTATVTANGASPNSTTAATTANKEKTEKKKKKSYKPLRVEYDENGRPKCPINVSKTMVITSLGEIDPHPSFHTATKIYPIGYRCDVAKISSSCRPGKVTTYGTTIERGDKGPKFVVTASDNPDFRVEGSSATSAWKKVVEKIEKLDPNAKTKKSSGTKRIGFHHPDVLKLIEALPRANECANYKKHVNKPDVVEIVELTPPPPPIAVSPKKPKKSKSNSPRKSRSPVKVQAVSSPPQPMDVDEADTLEMRMDDRLPTQNPNVVATIDLCSDSTMSPTPSQPPPPSGLDRNSKKRRLENGLDGEPERKKRRTSPKKTKKQVKLDQSFFARS